MEYQMMALVCKFILIKVADTDQNRRGEARSLALPFQGRSKTPICKSTELDKDN